MARKPREGMRVAETSNEGVILVAGATGHVGRPVVGELQRRGLPVRALTHHPGATGSPDGVEVVAGDLSVPDSVSCCLDGIEAVFLIWPFLSTDHAPSVVDAIAKHARRVVYLSSMSVRDDVERQGDPISQVHADMELLITQSDLDWTFLRPSGFATNTLVWAAQIRSGDVVRWPFGGSARSLIHEWDIAASAARVLTEDGHGGATYVLTGPHTVTNVEQVEMIGEAIGRRLRYEEISREDARSQLIAHLPASAVEGALDAWASFVAEPELVTPTFGQLTGSPARPFRDWAIDHADEFR